MAREFWQWQHHRRKSLPPDEAEWEKSFGVLTVERTKTIAHYRKTWSFRVRYWFRRKFIWRA